MDKSDRKQKFINLMNQEIPKTTASIWMKRLDKMGFFTAPASIHHHGAYEGGLFDHSYQVTLNLVNLTNWLHLTWLRPQSPYIVGMFHDLCKCDNYKCLKPDDIHPEAWVYSDGQLLTGHGEKSVIMLQQFVCLTEEEMLCVRWHMGAFDSEKNWNAYGQSITKYQNVLWTHTADMMAARIQGV